MTKLYYTESGHSMPNLAEELTTFRRARKVLTLPPTSSPATLYFIARAHEGIEPAPSRLRQRHESPASASAAAMAHVV